jgi:hypothetical protein
MPQTILRDGWRLVADAGANLRELLERMGHASSRAALIYLHSTEDRQRTLAEAISQRAHQDLTAESCGTRVARRGLSDASDDPWIARATRLSCGFRWRPEQCFVS